MHKLRLCGQGVCEQGACGECASQQRGPSSCEDSASVTGLRKRALVTAVHLEVYWFVVPCILFVLGCPLSAGCAIVLVSVAVPLPVLVFRDCWMLAGPFCRRFRHTVALVQLKHVTGLVLAAWLLHRRGLPQSRIFLLDVVRNAWLAYFQWPAAKSAAPAAVCSWSSASNLHPEPEDVLVVAPSRPAANTKCFAVCCSQCLAYLLPMASG